MVKGYKASAVGKRKTAVARAYLKDGSGVIQVNGREFETYFDRATLRMLIKQPLITLKKSESFDIRLNVVGGGRAGQAGACRHAISRALLRVDPEFRPALKSAGYLTRDAREVERKKFGLHKARKRPQYSKR